MKCTLLPQQKRPGCTAAAASDLTNAHPQQRAQAVWWGHTLHPPHEAYMKPNTGVDDVHTGVDSGRRREQFCLWPCLSTHNAQIDCTESLSKQNTLNCSLMSSGVPLSRGREGAGHRAAPWSVRLRVRAAVVRVDRPRHRLCSMAISVVSFLKHSYAIPSPFSNTIILSHLRPHQSSPQAVRPGLSPGTHA